jgi:hypothetical protein
LSGSPGGEAGLTVNKPLSGVALGVAVLMLAGFAVLVIVLVVQSDSDDVTWTRLAWIFTSVEAIAFGAAGALFGSSIQRERAEKAEESARENAQGAANGKALAEMIKAEDPAAPAGVATLESLGAGAERNAAASVAARHAEVARKLFP